MILGKEKNKYLISLALIAISLFNYANANLFWHCHRMEGASIVHSHIYGKNHGTGDTSGGHTPGQIQIIDIIFHSVFTADAVPEFHLERLDVLNYILQVPLVLRVVFGFSDFQSLRAPPVLV